MNKKLIVWIVGILAALGVSNAQTLTLSTEGDGTFGYGCLVPVDVYADAGGNKIETMDLFLKSALEFVDFVPSNDFFGHFFVPTSDGIITHIGGLITIGLYNTGYGKVGTVYYKHNGDHSFRGDVISVVFDGVGLAGDSSLNSNGKDILNMGFDLTVYFDGDIPECGESSEISGGMIGLDKHTVAVNIINDMETEYKQFVTHSKNSKILLFGGLCLLIIIICCYFYYRKQRKGKEF